MTGPPAALRVIFLGTPAFALPSLRTVAETTTLVAVVTQPDKPAGRGRTLTAPPVAQAAAGLGVPVLQPRTLKDPAVVAALARHAPDLLVTVAYGRIIPAAVLALPRLGCINLHPSLLPLYRGASPIQRAVADGAATTGVTVLYMTDELDAGDIILQREVPIGPEETAGELEARLAREGAALLREAIDLIARGVAPRRPQDHARATYAGRLDKEDGRIDWNRPAVAIVNLVRAMHPWPSAYTTWRGIRLKVWRAARAEGTGAPGQVLAAAPDRITVAAGQGAVDLLELQPEGGRRMSAAAFLRGHPLRSGERLGNGIGALPREGMVE
jgi:methionyl-tRNA formyltransferase